MFSIEGEPLPLRFSCLLSTALLNVTAWKLDCGVASSFQLPFINGSFEHWQGRCHQPALMVSVAFYQRLFWTGIFVFVTLVALVLFQLPFINGSFELKEAGANAFIAKVSVAFYQRLFWTNRGLCRNYACVGSFQLPFINGSFEQRNYRAASRAYSVCFSCLLTAALLNQPSSGCFCRGFTMVSVAFYQRLFWTHYYFSVQRARGSFQLPFINGSFEQR